MSFKIAYLLMLPSTFAVGGVMIHSFGTVSAISKLIPLKCPLNYFFEILCPTCGLGRSLIAAWTFNFNQSWSLHPLGLLILLGACLLWLGLLLNKETFVLNYWSKYKINPSFMSLGVLVYAIWGFGRNI